MLKFIDKMKNTAKTAYGQHTIQCLNNKIHTVEMLKSHEHNQLRIQKNIEWYKQVLVTMN